MKRILLAFALFGATAALDCKNLLDSAQENVLSLLAEGSKMAEEFISSNEPGVVESRNSLIAVAVLAACYGSYKFYNYVTTPKK
ncbi:MAG: hypothetical protein K2X90_04405 [Candidatus Babeliaceae bacterium]|nr:hypothetical protein [Candidatus Babeliaceae bacterium]